MKLRSCCSLLVASAVACAASASIVLDLELEGLPPGQQSQEVAVRLIDPISKAPVEEYFQTCDGDGGATVHPGLSGVFDIRVKASHWLSHTVEAQRVWAYSPVYIDATLRNGDCNGDDAVNLDDYLILAAVYELSAGEEGWDARADLTEDLIVNLDDYLLLAANYETTGASEAALASEGRNFLIVWPAIYAQTFETPHTEQHRDVRGLASFSFSATRQEARAGSAGPLFIDPDANGYADLGWAGGATPPQEGVFPLIGQEAFAPPFPPVVRLTSTRPFVCHPYRFDAFATEGYTALPLSGLGYDYVVAAIPPVPKGEDPPGYGAFMMIASPFASDVAGPTAITVTPSVACTLQRNPNSLEGEPQSGSPLVGGVPCVLRLLPDEYIVLEATGWGDLTGTTIESKDALGAPTDPVAVWCGSPPTTWPSLPPANADDTKNPAFEQVPPTDFWGRSFVAPAALRGAYRIVAAFDNTQVHVWKWDGGEYVQTAHTLFRGDCLDLIVTGADVAAHDSLAIHSLKPVAVVFARASRDPAFPPGPQLYRYDPSLTWIPSLDHARSDLNFAVPDLPDLNYDGPCEWEYDLLTIAFHDTTGEDPSTEPPLAGLAGVSYTGVGTNTALRAYDGTSRLPSANVRWGWADLEPGAYTVRDNSDPKRRLIGIVFGSNHYDSIAYMASMGGTYNGGAAPAPAPPTNLVATCVQPSVETDAYTIELAWTPPAGTVEGYKVQRFDATGQRWVTLATTTQAAYSVTEAQAPRDEEHAFRVAAYRDLTSAWAVAAPVATPPERPDMCDATPIANTHDRMHVRWVDMSEVETGSVVQRSPSADPPVWADVQTLPLGFTTFDDSGLTKLTTYRYRVKVLRDGLYAYGPVFLGTTHDEPPAPPAGLVATSSVWNRVDLAWVDASNNETSFELERSTDGFNYAPLQALPANATSFADTTARFPNTYTYRLRAVNGGGSSAWVPLEVTQSPPPVPASPTNLSAEVVSRTDIRLGWVDASDCEALQEVECSTDEGVHWAPLGTLGANETGFTHGGVAPNIMHSYRVRARNVSGSSTWSNIASATIQLSSETVVGLVAAATDTDKIMLYWKETAGATGYFVYHSMAVGGPYTRLTVHPVFTRDTSPGIVGKFEYLASQLSPNVEHFFRVSPAFGTVEGMYSEVASDIPNGRATPWHTKDARLIVAKANWESWGDNPGWDPSGWTIVVAPDGVLYCSSLTGETPYVSAAGVHYDEDSNLLVETGGSTYPICLDASSSGTSGQGPGTAGLYAWSGDPGADELVLVTQPMSTIHANYSRTDPPSGVYRKVEASGGHRVISGIVAFPGTLAGVSQTSASKDTAYIYVGGEGVGLSVDVGFQKGSDASNRPGWALYGTVWHNGTNHAAFQTANEVLVKGLRVGGATRFSFALPELGRDQIGTFSVSPYDVGGFFFPIGDNLQVPESVNVQVFLPGMKPNDREEFRMKRVNSIAQHLTPFRGAAASANSGSFPDYGYYSSGARVAYATWGGGSGSVHGAWLDGQLLQEDVNVYREGAYPGHRSVVGWRTAGMEYYYEDQILLHCVQP